ncbi:MAG: methenyltetrahydromethanopterin cyclohydrolase [Planctomycetales bacterium]|nr:methenyltetrahydromethanopterin cyclohydrolase [Planctomycetales bacterium]
MIHLNEQAAALCRQAIDEAERLNIARTQCPSGATLLDFGVAAPGGIAAGRRLAEICMAGLGQIEVLPGEFGAVVSVQTDHPAAACMAAQYAGWQISVDGYFAMGSGPMRALAAKEPLIQSLGLRETARVAVGVLESGKLPPPAACEKIARDCGVAPSDLILAVAPTASLAGTLQVVARSVETALHKMMELGFDVRNIASGFGCAPLPPVAADDLEGIARTNDAVLYGGETTLWTHGDDDALKSLVERVPSVASRDYGRPFREIFAAAGHDFYKIDPHLFSPAVVTLVSLDSGRVFRHGEVNAAVLRQSFGWDHAHSRT